MTGLGSERSDAVLQRNKVGPVDHQIVGRAVELDADGLIVHERDGREIVTAALQQDPGKDREAVELNVAADVAGDVRAVDVAMKLGRVDLVHVQIVERPVGFADVQIPSKVSLWDDVGGDVRKVEPILAIGRDDPTRAQLDLVDVERLPPLCRLAQRPHQVVHRVDVCFETHRLGPQQRQRLPHIVRESQLVRRTLEVHARALVVGEAVAFRVRAVAAVGEHALTHEQGTFPLKVSLEIPNEVIKKQVADVDIGDRQVRAADVNVEPRLREDVLVDISQVDLVPLLAVPIENVPADDDILVDCDVVGVDLVAPDAQPPLVLVAEPPRDVLLRQQIGLDLDVVLVPETFYCVDVRPVGRDVAGPDHVPPAVPAAQVIVIVDVRNEVGVGVDTVSRERLEVPGVRAGLESVGCPGALEAVLRVAEGVRIGLNRREVGRELDVLAVQAGEFARLGGDAVGHGGPAGFPPFVVRAERVVVRLGRQEVAVDNGVALDGDGPTARADRLRGERADGHRPGDRHGRAVQRLDLVRRRRAGVDVLRPDVREAV